MLREYETKVSMQIAEKEAEKMKKPVTVIEEKVKGGDEVPMI